MKANTVVQEEPSQVPGLAHWESPLVCRRNWEVLHVLFSPLDGSNAIIYNMSLIHWADWHEHCCDESLLSLILPCRISLNVSFELLNSLCQHSSLMLCGSKGEHKGWNWRALSNNLKHKCVMYSRVSLACLLACKQLQRSSLRTCWDNSFRSMLKSNRIISWVWGKTTLEKSGWWISQKQTTSLSN